jgi:hypothetical protein
MFENMILNRDKKLHNLYKISSYLGRSLRENVELFKYDDNLNKVWFVTESNKLISGVVSESGLTEVEVSETSEYLNDKEFDKKVRNQVNSLIGNLYRDNYSLGKQDLLQTLNLWEERLKLDKIGKLLESKSSLVSENKDILKSDQFTSLIEIIPSLVKFLNKNKDKVTKISEIKSAVILSKTLSEAFNMPKLTHSELADSKEYVISENENVSLYELITRQELIKKELLESRKNFNLIWVSHPKIVKLAESIVESDEEKLESLAEAINDIPYVALLSKKQMSEMFDTILNMSESMVSPKDIQEYSSWLFEAKKPVKREIINTLNEHYGINFQNLKEPASFRSLLNTQIVIFETINKILPKGSPQKPVLKQVIDLLKEKNGIEAIDVNDVIHYIFEQAGYEFLNESAMSRYLDFDSIASDLGNVANILKMIKASSAMAGMQGGQATMAANPPMQSPQPTPMPQVAQSSGGDPSEEDLGSDLPTDDEENVEIGGDMQDQVPQGGEEMPLEQPDMEGGEVPIEMSKEQLMSTMAELENILGDLKMKLGEGEGEEEMEEPEMEGEEEHEEPDGDEEMGGEKKITIDTGDGDDEVHIDQPEGSHDVEGEEEYQEEMGTKKKEKKQKKAKKEEDQ